MVDDNLTWGEALYPIESQRRAQYERHIEIVLGATIPVIKPGSYDIQFGYKEGGGEVARVTFNSRRLELRSQQFEQLPRKIDNGHLTIEYV
ncbi:MAG: hypothetical protein HY053_06045 [Proteobacteria bacterium]|nr:hypothetical protein [Pseudomonadota bacterium]